jgi:hypothetical protein
LEQTFGHLNAACIRFPLFLVVRRHRQSLPPHYPIAMKMQYLRQFPMVSHHPGLDLNAFSTVLNAMPSAFAIVFAFVFVAAVTVAMIRFFPQSYLRHFPIVQPHCGVI